MAGDLPVIGETRLQVGSADLGDRLPGLTLDTVEVSLPKAGGAARMSGAGRYTDKAFTFAGTFAVPERLDGRFSTLIDLNAQMAADGTKRSAEGSLALKGRLALDAGSFDGLDATVDLRMPALGGVAVGAIASAAGFDGGRALQQAFHRSIGIAVLQRLHILSPPRRRPCRRAERGRDRAQERDCRCGRQATLTTQMQKSADKAVATVSVV